MSDTTTAGWYSDPAGAEALRWWDGRTWTAHVRPREAPPATGGGSWTMPSPASGPVQYYSPTATAMATATPAQQAPFVPSVEPSPQVAYAPVAQLPFPPATIEPPRWPDAPASSSFAAGPTRSAQTVGIWLLAVFPLLAVPIAMLAQRGATYALVLLDLPIPGLAFIGAPVAIIVGWVFAGIDIGRLRKSGYRPPSILWMLLLPPIGYFIARGVALRRDGGKTWPAAIVLGISVAILGGFIAVMISVVLAFARSMGFINV